MLFGWLKRRRRRKVLSQTFPDEWLKILRRDVPYYNLLCDAEQAALRDDLRIFVAEKNWEGCNGLKMTDKIKVVIAAQACLLLLGIEHDYFSRVLSVLVYPSSFYVPNHNVGPDGLVRVGTANLGEAWYRGPVVLSWDEVRIDGRKYRDGRNVVLHEFAHQLDFLNALDDGTPLLRDRGDYRKWHEVMSAEYDRLVDASEHDRATLLDEYGATNPAEFFAVATECFFECAIEMEKRHPRLYEVLRDYYGQSTAERLRRASKKRSE